ncbi:MAG: hypothetical protein LBU79_04365 [Planctomycetota bacterium]|nr:hypothetical protein [Planctomycetota bacterium]
MQTRISKRGKLPTRTKRRVGRVVIRGVGADALPKQFYQTKSEHFELVGGSPATHQAMQEKARQIAQELSRQGYRLDRLPLEQFVAVSRIVARICSESPSVSG